MAEPVRVGALLGSVPGLTHRLADARAAARLVQTWPAIAGPAGARSRAEGIDQGVLHVAVDSSGWLHRLTLEEARLLGRCREIAPIRAIRFRLVPPRDAVAPAPGIPTSLAEGEVRP